MNSKVRSGFLYLDEESFPATVKLLVTPNPPSPVRRQRVEVEFHKKEPANYKLVVAGEMTFKEDSGAEYVVQHDGTRWTLKAPQEFLE